MKYTHVVWDFNGTVFDDVEAGIDSVNIMLSERGLKTIPSVRHYREIFDFPIEDYYAGLGFDFSAEPYEKLAPEWVALYDERAQNAGLCEGVESTMRCLCGADVEQLVISACEIGMLNRYLERLGVRGYLGEVIGLDNIHARSKVALAEAWRETHADARVLMVGDTTHDHETALALKADCLLYAGGHQSREKLATCGCPIIETIPELLNYI